ncbi:MAG: hypothetical protein ACJAYU_001621 [Bradymonadia bacterium]|jgi:hypothetical protein
MRLGEAYRMGYQTASCGFFFDGLEMVAGASPDAVGGIEGMRGALELLFAQKDVVNSRMDELSAKVHGAFKSPVSTPTTVDEYRALMTNGVFEIVNRWSYIADIKQVTRLQAWFYAGFGLGRAETVTRGVELFARLYELVGGTPAVEQMPVRLNRLAAEAAKQMSVAAEEDDLRSVRPLLEDGARRISALSILTSRAAGDIQFSHSEDLEFYRDADRKITLDLAS